MIKPAIETSPVLWKTIWSCAGVVVAGVITMNLGVILAVELFVAAASSYPALPQRREAIRVELQTEIEARNFCIGYGMGLVPNQFHPTLGMEQYCLRH